MKLQSSTAWLLVAVTLFSVLSFVGADVYAQRRAARMDRQASLLVDGVAPAIERLSAARGALHRMVEAARDGAAGRAAPETAAATTLRERGRLDEHRDRFSADATAPSPLRDQAVAALETVEERARQIALELMSGQLGDARRQVDSLDELADAADRAMEEMVLWHAAETSRDGMQLRRSRRHASFVSYVLHAGAALVALLAMGIAVVLARQTERLEHERSRAVEERNRLAEARAAELDGFASRVAHDIKSPLAALSLRVAVAERRDQNDETLRRIHDGLRALFPVVDDLLEFARAGGQPQTDALSALTPVIEAVVDEARPALIELGAELTVDDHSHAAVACPPGVLLSVIGNLVRNAVKFLPDGREPRRLIIRASDGATRVRVEVEDTGPGVPPGQEQVIFERFARGATLRPGLGLGLATVKRLVTAYGGEVGVCNVADGGACFWFELPRAREDDAPANAG